MTPFYSEVIAIFEIAGDNTVAQEWALNRLGVVGDIRQINITRWVEPWQNEAVVTVREGEERGKYTVKARLNLDAEGYADAQNKIVAALTADPETVYVNIQSVTLTKA
jgi:hypothetical protein